MSRQSGSFEDIPGDIDDSFVYSESEGRGGHFQWPLPCSGELRRSRHVADVNTLDGVIIRESYQKIVSCRIQAVWASTLGDESQSFSSPLVNGSVSAALSSENDLIQVIFDTFVEMDTQQPLPHLDFAMLVHPQDSSVLNVVFADPAAFFGARGLEGGADGWVQLSEMEQQAYIERGAREKADEWASVVTLWLRYKVHSGEETMLHADVECIQLDASRESSDAENSSNAAVMNDGYFVQHIQARDGDSSAAADQSDPPFLISTQDRSVWSVLTEVDTLRPHKFRGAVTNLSRVDVGSHTVFNQRSEADLHVFLWDDWDQKVDRESVFDTLYSEFREECDGMTQDGIKWSDCTRRRMALGWNIPCQVEMRSIRYSGMWMEHQSDIHVSPDSFASVVVSSVECEDYKDPSEEKTVEYFASSVSYFEVTVQSVGGDEGLVAIGLAQEGYPHNCMPGMEHNSFGYHGDDGYLYTGRAGAASEKYGPKFGKGDTVGCGFDSKSGDMWFTLNGSFLGIARSNVKAAPFHATVGLSPGGKVLVNLGGENAPPFAFEGSMLGLTDSPQGGGQLQDRPGGAVVTVGGDEKGRIRAVHTQASTVPGIIQSSTPIVPRQVPVLVTIRDVRVDDMRTGVSIPLPNPPITEFVVSRDGQFLFTLRNEHVTGEARPPKVFPLDAAGSGGIAGIAARNLRQHVAWWVNQQNQATPRRRWDAFVRCWLQVPDPTQFNNDPLEDESKQNRFVTNPPRVMSDTFGSRSVVNLVHTVQMHPQPFAHDLQQDLPAECYVNAAEGSPLVPFDIAASHNYSLSSLCDAKTLEPFSTSSELFTQLSVRAGDNAFGEPSVSILCYDAEMTCFDWHCEGLALDPKAQKVRWNNRLLQAMDVLSDLHFRFRTRCEDSGLPRVREGDPPPASDILARRFLNTQTLDLSFHRATEDDNNTPSTPIQSVPFNSLKEEMPLLSPADSTAPRMSTPARSIHGSGGAQEALNVSTFSSAAIIPEEALEAARAAAEAKERSSSFRKFFGAAVITAGVVAIAAKWLWNRRNQAVKNES